MTQHGESAPDVSGTASSFPADGELRPLDRRAVSAWRLDAVLDTGMTLLFCAGAALGLRWLGAPDGVALLPLLLALAVGVVGIGVLPERRWRNWRYAIGETEIELRQGIWWQTRTRIPMARVQHVDTRRGPIERRYGLADLVLYTAAGSRMIPGLSLEVAERSRERIALLANVRDDV